MRTTGLEKGTGNGQIPQHFFLHLSMPSAIQRTIKWQGVKWQGQYEEKGIDSKINDLGKEHVHCFSNKDTSTNLIALLFVQ